MRKNRQIASIFKDFMEMFFCRVKLCYDSLIKRKNAFVRRKKTKFPLFIFLTTIPPPTFAEAWRFRQKKCFKARRKVKLAANFGQNFTGILRRSAAKFYIVKNARKLSFSGRKIR